MSADLEARIKRLEGLTSVYGDTLDELRNRVWDLEHGIPRRHRDWEDDAGDDEVTS